MQASKKSGARDGFSRLCNYPMQELQSSSKSLGHHQGSDDASQGAYSSFKRSTQNCTTDSSTAAGFCAPYSPSTVSLSPDGSPMSQRDSHSYPSDTHSPKNAYGSPVSGSCLTDDANDLKHKLRELETAMLAPDSELVEVCGNSILGGQQPNVLERGQGNNVSKMIADGELKNVLIACAEAVADDDILTTEWLMSELRQMVSVSGEPLQRLGAYMLEGLVARLSSSGSSIYKALRCKEPTGPELLSYMHMLYEICPYFKFGYMSANGAIAEAMKDETRIHIIDFQITQGTQWITLIRALAARPGGPPHIRITGIDDSTAAHARGGGLHIVGQRLARLAESCKVPFEFHSSSISGSKVELEELGIQPGEAVAVNFAMALHHMPDESVDTRNHRDRVLRLVKSLSPKVVTLVEQESNNNTAPFLLRFVETLNYYLAVFESIDVTMPRDHKDRILVEQHCLAREIVNIIACEGAERVERHEALGKWKLRFAMAGFSPFPLSSFVNATIKTILEEYCDKYTLREKDGVLYLGWMNRDLVAACAWK